jgi:hypothetical protein
MIPTRRRGVGGRSIVRDPSAKRVFLPAKLSGPGLFLWKLRFHLSINEHESVTPQLLRVDSAAWPKQSKARRFVVQLLPLTAKNPNATVARIYVEVRKTRLP